VLEVVAQLGLACRVLVVGSSEEYGAIAPHDLPIDEDTPLRPTSAYAVSKVTQDLLGLQYWFSRQVEAVRVRPFNHIGPRQRQGFVAPDFASQIARIEAGLRPPQLAVGALDVARDFSDVRDIVRGYHLALTQGRAGEVYNLGAGQAHTVRELLNTLIAASGAAIEIVQDPERTRLVEVPRMVADCTRMADHTGWRTQIPFERSLSDVLDYWREQVRSGATDPTPVELQPRK
jgi:GDP-4-dehydro-6-deoxy-D-mannose reductase